MSDISFMIQRIQEFQEATKKERVARDALATQVYDYIRPIAVEHLRGPSAGLPIYDASDLRQSVIRILAEEDFQALAHLDVSNEASVIKFFREVVKNKLTSEFRKTIALKRGGRAVEAHEDDQGNLKDHGAEDPDAMLIQIEDLAQWKAKKDRLSEEDRRLVELAEAYWNRGERPDWIRIAGQLSAITPDTYRLRCYHIRMAFRKENDVGRDRLPVDSQV